MDYDHIELSQIEPYEAPLGENGVRTHVVLRSIATVALAHIGYYLFTSQRILRSVRC